jgi:hypothetical protein
MRNKNRLLQLGLVILCSAGLLAGNSSWGADDFYVIGGGSPWKRNGSNIYYTAGKVGIGTTNPIFLLDIVATDPNPFRVYTTGSGGNAIIGHAGNGVGVLGSSTTSHGVWGQADGYGAGVYGANAFVGGYGVYGKHYAGGIGVYGEAKTTTPSSSAGVKGVNIGTAGAGVIGIGATGVAGETTGTDTNNFGVSGYATGSASGVWGFNYNGNGNGVYGSTETGTGVYGRTGNGTAYGVRGENTGTGGKGVWGSGPGVGVYGNTTASSGGIGVYAAAAGNNYALYAENTTGGYAGYFNGNFAAVNGTKLAIVPTSKGNKKLYCQESTEVWFEDFGEGQLMGGTAHIDLDPVFLETVTINHQHPMKVFIQLNDDCHGVYVQRQATGFQVRELGGGASGAHFTYRVVAKRKGYDQARLETAPDLSAHAALKTPEK